MVKTYLRVRSTPRKLLTALAEAHQVGSQDICFIGKVQYKKEEELEAYVKSSKRLEIAPRDLAGSLLLKRRAFEHENEVRLIYFGTAISYINGLYGYTVDPHTMVTQIMADPNRDRKNWAHDKAAIKAATGFNGEIKRSKIYDPPDWQLPSYRSTP